VSGTSVTDPKQGSLAQLAVEDGRLRAAERNLLILELQDVIIHQLSNASLQVMSQFNGDDASELREVLRQVGDSTESALAELRLLVRVGRDDPAAAAVTDAIGELSQRFPPTEAVARWAQRLLDAGFDPVINFPHQADRLRMSMQGTLVRAMDATGDNILQHAPARSRCAITLRVNATHVLLEVTSSLRTATVAHSVPLGRSLRSLRERVDLTGGGFHAGPSLSASGDGEWAVVVLLPRE
jgi:signal transduction histidine kinase